MANHRRRPRPKGAKDSITLVLASVSFEGRTTPPPMLGFASKQPFSHHIPKDTHGILRGNAQGASDLFDIEFEGPNGTHMRVEVRPDQIEYL